MIHKLPGLTLQQLAGLTAFLASDENILDAAVLLRDIPDNDLPRGRAWSGGATKALFAHILDLDGKPSVIRSSLPTDITVSVTIQVCNKLGYYGGTDKLKEAARCFCVPKQFLDELYASTKEFA